jgi:molybdopterin-guanine dinucleotide biosynthesis protein A
MRTAVVVAGGRSTRFGDRDKIVTDLAGSPMIRRVAERLTRACDAVVVNCRADQRDAVADALGGLSVPVDFAVDPDPDHGPVAGIGTGLRAVDTEYALVVAGDMPFVDPDFVDYLFDRVGDHDAVLPRPDDWYQPMQAVYRAEAMADACDAALAAHDGEGDPRILAPVFDFDLSHVVVDAAEIERVAASDTFDNVNTEDELAAAAAKIRRSE